MNKLPQLRTLSLLALFAMATHSHAADDQAVRTIAVPAREHGYSNFETRTITSQADLDGFLKEMSAASGWNNFGAFRKALAEAKPDLEKKTLVLIRHTERSGSVKVTFHEPRVEEKKVICRIDRTKPKMGTADMAYYCFALVVAKDAATHVEVQVQGRQPINIPLKKE